MKPPHPHISSLDSELYHSRFIARVCVALVCLVQFFARIATIFNTLTVSGIHVKLLLFSIPFAPLMTVIVAIEYFLFRKHGPGMARFSFLVDLVLLFLFTGDWMTGAISYLLSTETKDPPLFSVPALYGFIGFAWRALLVTLIVQKWQLKIIAPVVVSILTTGFTMHYDSKHFYFYLIRCVAQVFNIVVIIYCEDKIKWKMIWTNLQQENWMQVNNFILNNIPENIMILDFKGEAKFISDYCRNFMEKCCLPSLHLKDFFSKMRDLEEQQADDVDPSSPVGLQMERITTGNELLIGARTFLSLADFIMNFKNIVREKNLQERQFLIYNAKLQIEEDQQDKSIEIKVSFVQHDEIKYIILIFRDMTQRDLVITLEKTNKYKDQLLASVSHELRAPLNGNINLVETAVNSPKIPEQIKETLLTPALRSSKFLLHLINDILDMSQIKEKKLRLVFQSGDLRETLQGTAQLVELQAKKKGIQLLIELDPSLSQNFWTDHIRLGQIVLNLLSNAIKFTKEGVIKLKAVSMDQPAWIKISVEDSGIGMTQENMNRLFSSYTHIEFEGRNTINPTGVGLGLNIASNLVQLLAPIGHQRIAVVSNPNQGSVFSFIVENKENLPTQIPEDELNSSDNNSHIITGERPGTIKPKFFSALTKSETPQRETCSCPKILKVDDNLFNIMAFETILNSLDIKCDSVYSGHSAIEKLLYRENKKCGNDCQSFSVIFMDQEMPEMNGIETVKEIRKLQKEKRISLKMRIIGCTAHHSKQEVDKFFAAGLDGCIHKPISITMIQDILL